jgi:hypothetical protein
LRLLEAGDAIFRGSARGAYTRQLATRQAIKEGYSGADAVATRAHQIMSNLDEHPDLVDLADKQAKKVVFQEHRSDIPLAGGKQGAVSAVRSILLPFVRTPYNVAAQGLGMTPAGLLGVIAAAKKGDTSLATERAAKAVIGTGIMALGLKLAADGHLTAGYPDNPSERSTLPAGWSPWSFKVDGPGGPSYIRFSQLGGVGVPLAIASSMVDHAKRGDITDPGKAVSALISGPGSYLVDQTMLQQVQNIMDAANDPQHKAEALLESTAAGFMPYGALGRQIQRAGGVANRDPNNALEAMAAVYPGLSGMVQPKLDAMGRTVKPTQTGIGTFASPLPYSMEDDNTALAELHRVGAGISAQPDSYRNLALTPQEQRQIQQQTGYYVNKMVNEMRTRPDYLALTRDQQREVMRNIVSSARDAGSGDILRGLSQAELQQRADQQKTKQATQAYVA